MRWRTLCVLALLSALIPHFAQANEWEKVEHKDGVQVYLRDYPDSALPEFKAVTEVESSMASVLAVLLDVEAYPEWVHSCREAFALAVTSDTEQYVYQVNRIPFARDRDIILRAKLSHGGDLRHITIALQAAPEFCESNPLASCEEVSEGHTRIEKSEGAYHLDQLDEERVQIVWQQHLEPGGKIPAWLIKSKLRELSLKTLINFREQVQKPGYQSANIEMDGEIIRLINGTEIIAPDEAPIIP